MNKDIPFSNTPLCFTPFKAEISQYTLPKNFTFPFYYTPDPLCELATQELQSTLESNTTWQHYFGISNKHKDAVGKMFGVLIVKNTQGNIGYLSAYSGKFDNQENSTLFVPPVFNEQVEDDYFLEEQVAINQLNEKIKHLEIHPKIVELSLTIKVQQNSAATEIKSLQVSMSVQRKIRKQQRKEAENILQEKEITALYKKLADESIQEKLALRDLKLHWQRQIDETNRELDVFEDKINQLKENRKTRSAALQQRLFSQYRFLNINNVEQNLNDIFEDTPEHIPPAGAGDCAAPKLLQYAFSHNLTPIAMAEFWWGTSPKSEIRQHKNFYPACLGKCQPILGHMLQGMNVEKNPLLENPANGKHLEIIYQDDDILVVNKPAEFLSVPGKTITDSVYSRIKHLFPAAKGAIIVHRLDMSTSGLMVIALTKRATKDLQKQFINRSVKKRYVALIDGILMKDEGDIALPLRGDLYDRPRQLVCYEHGKKAETRWQVIERDIEASQTKVFLHPKTGRTHQLRVHCAHSNGLAMPIVGDDLYGKQDSRLHLHAETLCFNHPISKEPLTFQVDAEF